MRYRGGSERSREVFSIHCNAVQNSHTEKGRCFNYSPGRETWLLLQSSGLNGGPRWALFGVTQMQEFGSLQRGQNVPFSSHQLSSKCTLTLQGKTDERHVGAGVPGGVQTLLWHIQHVCTPGEDCHAGTVAVPTDSPQEVRGNGKIVELCVTGTFCSPANKQIDVAFLWW